MLNKTLLLVTLVMGGTFGMPSQYVIAKEYSLNTAQARQIATPIDKILLAQQKKDILALMSQFHPQVRLLWSNGKFFKTSLEVKQAYQRSFLAYTDYQGSWLPEYVHIDGDTAWTTGETSWGFRVIDSGNVLHLTARSTYLLKKYKGQWKVIYEHSSHRRSD